MAGDRSAYAALGLEPGANAAAIERAYKNLIKRYHPDREGGDAGRAAEITKAYRELRGPGAREALELNDFELPAKRRRFDWVGAGLTAIAAVLIFIIVTGPLGRLTAVPRLPLDRIAAAKGSDPMNQPVAAIAVDRGVRDALRLSRTSDEAALAATSRDCHHQLRVEPSLAQLDRCAAFDDAVVVLQDRDPLRDQGPFSELAVTGRQWGGAQSLSNDNLAIDSRLDRIRLRVELALAPAPQPLPQPPTPLPEPQHASD